MDKRTENILQLLHATYPNARCELNYSNTFELLVAVILSAQCTDKRVNKLTPELFSAFPDAYSMSRATEDDLKPYIYSAGFYRNKARSLIGASRDIIERFGGEVPHTLDELITLQGVGRKTANVMLSEAFHQPGLAVDTHVFRVSHRLGLANESSPDKVEMELKAIIDKDMWSLAHHLLIFHGRYTCHARNPECNNCAVYQWCLYSNKQKIGGKDEQDFINK